MAMTSGDFILSYSTPDQTSTFDAIVTVYFIDTCPNLFRYIDTVHNALKPGGLWINIGPLLWHFDNRCQSKSPSPTHRHSDSTPNPESSSSPSPSSSHDNSIRRSERVEDTGIAEPGSFELSNDEVLHLIQHFGFTIEKAETNLDERQYGGYIRDPESMLQSLYSPVHWVARKGR